MTQDRDAISTRTPVRSGLLVTALALLALTGCGSEVSGGGSPGEANTAVAVKTSPAQPRTEEAAFAEKLDAFARRCPAAETAAPRPADATPTVSAEPIPSFAPGETPPTDPIEPLPVTGPPGELSARDFCAGGRHEQPIMAALLRMPEPTPAKVRKVLNDLGYIDERIHGLQQDGATTRFYLDLRESGGQLCEAGVAAGVATDVAMCVAAATGPFKVTLEDERP